MRSMRMKTLGLAISALLLVSVQVAHAQQMPPPPGGTTQPPTGGTTQPPTGGTTQPPTGGTTQPPTGGTTQPPTGGTTQPPTGGTTQPPTGGTTTPKPCFIPVAGVTAPAGVEVCSNISIPTGGSGSTDSSSFFKNVTTDQLAGMGADQLKKFDPTAASGFTPTQLGALSPDAMKGMSPDLVKNLAPTAMTGMKDSQIAALLPDAVKGLTADQIKNLPTSAMGGFTTSQIAQMQPTQLASMKTDQFSSLNPSAVGGLTPEQFKALPSNLVGSMDTSKLAALDPSVIKTMDKSTLSQLNPSAVKALDPKEMSEMLVNMNKQTIAPADVKALLPAGWSVDDKTGKVTAPAGSNLTLPTATTTTNTNVTLPKAPDLTKGLALGGDSTSGSVIDGMKAALEKAGLAGYNLTQTNGVLNVQGSGSAAATKMAFIADNSNIKQAASGAGSGLSQTSDGRYVITTADGVAVPVIPVLKSPEAVTQASPGAKVEVDASGSTKITQSGKTPIVGIAEPAITNSTQAPGIYRSGSGASEKVTVVYSDGTAQTMKPAIQDPSEFKTAAGAIPGVSDVTVKTDGTISVNYKGQQLTLKPTFDVTPGSGTSTTPSVSTAGGTFTFTNSKGDVQKFTL